MYSHRFEREKDTFLSKIGINKHEFDSVESLIRNNKINLISDIEDEFVVIDISSLRQDGDVVSPLKTIEFLLSNIKNKLILTASTYTDLSNNRPKVYGFPSITYRFDFIFRIDDKVEVIKNRYK